MLTNSYINSGVDLATIIILAGFTVYAVSSFLKAKRIRKQKGFFQTIRRLQKVIFVSVYLVAICGWAIGFYSGKKADTEIRNSLINNASRIANGIHPRYITSLTFSPTDLENSIYHRLNDQLQNMRQVFDGIEIFTITRKENFYAYGPSALGTDSVVSAQPGTKYLGANEILDQLYLEGEYFTHGPYFNDSKWVITAFASVLKTRSVTPLLMVGVNMPKSDWESQICEAQLLPKVTSLILIILVIIIFLIESRGKMVKYSGDIWWKSPEAVVSFICGLIITTLISYYTISSENKFRSSIFKQMSSAQVSQIRAYTYSMEYRMNAVAIALSNAENLTDSTFHNIVSPLYNNNFITKVGLAVTHHNFNQGNDSLPIVKFVDPSFQFPILIGHPFPKLTNKTPQLIENSFSTRLNNFDGPFIMPNSSKETVCYYYPITLSVPDSIQALLFMMADPELILKEAISVQGPGKSHFMVTQISDHDHQNKNYIASFPSRLDNYSVKSKLESAYPQLIYGGVFYYYFREGEQFKELYPRLASTLSPLAGLILTILLSYFVGLISTRRAHLEKKVQVRTLQLEQSQTNYRMISENIVDVIWIYNIQLDKMIFTSPSVNKIFGYTVEESLKMGLRDILSPSSFESVMKILPESINKYENGLRTDSVKINLLEQVRKDGVIIITEVVTSLIPDDTGKVIEILGVTRDITEKVKARKALEESEGKYRFLIENQQDLIIKIDRNGRFLYASPTYCKTFKTDEKQLIGQIFNPEIDEQDARNSINPITKNLSLQLPVQFHHRVNTVYGWKWLAWINTSVIEPNGELNGYICVGRDITKQKEYELELIESRQKLQNQNEEFAMLNEQYHEVNEELLCTNEELVNAIERATESENLKTAFLQNMSHEIRTPLNAIIGFSEMFSLSDLSMQDKHDYSEIISNSSRQLLSIVNDILTISTLETRQEKIKLNSVSINTIIKELDMAFQANAKTKNLKLITEIPKNNEEVIINTDEMKLKQILNNLIGNAIKFTYKGYVRFGFEKDAS